MRSSTCYNVKNREDSIPSEPPYPHWVQASGKGREEFDSRSLTVSLSMLAAPRLLTFDAIDRRRDAKLPSHDAGWSALKIGVKRWYDDREYAFEILRTYDNPYSERSEYDSRMTAACEYLTRNGMFYEPLAEMTRANGFRFPAHR